MFRTRIRSSEISWLLSHMANVFQHKQMSHFTCTQNETAHHIHLHNGQHTGNTSHTPPISWHWTTVRPQMDNTHTEHNQQSTEDTKHARKKPQTSLHNCKITGIQDNSQTPRCVHHDYSHYTRVSFLQKQLNWLRFSVRRLQSRLILFYKICQQKIVIPIPPYLQIPLRTTRHTSNIIEHSYRYRHLSTSTDTYQYSYFPRTITYLNSLPPSLCATPTVQDLKWNEMNRALGHLCAHIG